MANDKSLTLREHLPHLTAQECYNPRLVIESMFYEGDMVEEQCRLEQWLRCAFSRQQLSERRLFPIPHFQLNLLRLLEMSTLLAKEAGFKDREQPSEGDMLNERWFFRRRDFHQYACRYYPRYLRPHQFINPYLVFEGCTKWLSLKDWENLLDDMLTAATSRKNIY